MIALQTFIMAASFQIIVTDGISENTQIADLKSIKEFLTKGMEAIMQGVGAAGSAAGVAISRSGVEQASVSTAAPAGGKACCSARGCGPCPLPAIPMQFYPVPAPPPLPAVVPMRTVFEPVEHDHPPLHRLREMLSQKRWRHLSSSSASSSESDTSSSTSSDTSSDIDYYDNFPMRVRGF